MWMSHITETIRNLFENKYKQVLHLDKIKVLSVLNKYRCPRIFPLDNSIIIYFCHVYSNICEILYIKIKEYLNFKIDELDLVDEQFLSLRLYQIW